MSVENLGIWPETVGEFDRWRNPRVEETRRNPQQSSAQQEAAR